MKVGQRIECYKAIEDYRKRPLIAYATSTRVGVPAIIAGDAVREFIDQIDSIEEGNSIDVLIHSTGGDPLTAWKLMSLLRERFENIGVLVPSMSFSAATLFALGADEIVMHPHSSLGPIDPQITITTPDGKPRVFSFEDVGAFLRFLSEEVHLTEQAVLSPVVDKLFSAVDPVQVGAAKRASELSTEVGERLLQMHMTSTEDRTRARSIAEGLNKSFFAHGDAVSRTRARVLSLKIAPDDRKLENLIWKAFIGIEEYMELRKPFIPLKHFLENGGAASVAPKAPVALPPDTPAPLAQQVWSGIAQAAMAASAQKGLEVPYGLVTALIESRRIASESFADGWFVGTRMPNGEVRVSAVPNDSRWRSVQISGNVEEATPTEA